MSDADGVGATRGTMAADEDHGGWHDVRVAVIGGGLSGIGAAVMLRRAGIGDVVVLERADDVGGTWRDNTYPGCACDVPSALYSFSFAPNPAWGRLYARQPEIQSYARRIADEHGAREHVVTGADVLAADWDEAAQRWPIRTTRGALARAGADLRDRPLERAGRAGPAGPRGLRRDGLPLLALGPRPRPDGPARGGDRHRRLGRAVRAARSSRRWSG